MSVTKTRKSFGARQIQRLKREMTLGQRIRFARTYAKLSHDQLGKAAGTSRHHLIKLEKGIHRPKPDMAARIAEATGVPLELLTDPDDSEGPDVVTIQVSRDQYAIYQALMGRARDAVLA